MQSFCCMQLNVFMINNNFIFCKGRQFPVYTVYNTRWWFQDDSFLGRGHQQDRVHFMSDDEGSYIKKGECLLWIAWFCLAVLTWFWGKQMGSRFAFSLKLRERLKYFFCMIIWDVVYQLILEWNFFSVIITVVVINDLMMCNLKFY